MDAIIEEEDDEDQEVETSLNAVANSTVKLAIQCITLDINTITD